MPTKPCFFKRDGEFNTNQVTKRGVCNYYETANKIELKVLLNHL